jgi:hypothetical protein
MKIFFFVKIFDRFLLFYLKNMVGPGEVDDLLDSKNIQYSIFIYLF